MAATAPPAARRRRTLAWLAAAALLLAASAGLNALVEPKPAPAGPPPAYPRAMRSAEYERRDQRRTVSLAPPPAAAAAATARGEEAAPRRSDPFLQALPARPGEPAVVLEANALRHSRLGELFVACMLARDPEAFRKVQAATGLDPLKDVDRVGFTGDGLVVSGTFAQARWDDLAARSGAPETYGDAGRLYAVGKPGETLAVWRDQLVIASPDAASARATIDRLEGRAPPAEPAIGEDLAFGEVYGVVPGEALRRLAAGQGSDFADRLAAAAGRVELHVDAMHDVAAVVRVEGQDGPALADLARSLGGLIAAGRLQAQGGGDAALADLLDAARVVPSDGRFTLELALPEATLERWFEGCAGRERPGAAGAVTPAAAAP